MTTAAPARRTRAAAVHVCVDCLALPELPPGVPTPTGSYAAAGYRPPKPRPTTGGPRSQRCHEHRLAHRNAGRVTAAAGRKRRGYGLDADLQAALWTYQGGRCPSGVKVADELPAGVATDHDHTLAATHDHPVDKGCPRCVTGFLSTYVNRDVVGRLTGMVGRANVPAALRAIADHLDNPPLARLLAEHPELLDEPTPTGVAA